MRIVSLRWRLRSRTLAMPRTKESFGRSGRNTGVNLSIADAMGLVYKRCSPPTETLICTQHYQLFLFISQDHLSLCISLLFFLVFLRRYHLLSELTHGPR